MTDLTFLNEFGLTDIQIEIYDYILNNKFGTINKIKSILNYSYTQVRNNLNALVDKKLISSSLEEKERVFYRINPKSALTEILELKNKTLLKKIDNLDDDIKSKESFRGVCVKEISFYHHSDYNIALENLINLIINATKRIVFSSVPPTLLDKLKHGLHESFMKGVEIKIFYSQLDFEGLTNYFELVTDILKNVKFTIIETEEKTCRNIRFNDLIVNEGMILIDEGYFNSVLFLDDVMFHFNGFFSSIVLNQANNMLEFKSAVKSVEINPESMQNILEIIKEVPSLKTRDLSEKSKIGGSKLRKILEFLINQDIVEEKIIKDDKAGRPCKIYLIKNEHSTLE